MAKVIKLNQIKLGQKNPFVLIAGPCVIESKAHAFKMAQSLQKITQKLNIPFVFKASYDKANRTSIDSYRGPGIAQGLEILQYIKTKLNVPVLSDVHDLKEIDLASEVLDIMQIPAFLCRQTDLVVAVAKTGRVVNVKKGQFLSPHDVGQIIRKIESSGNKNILLTERGTSFGYNNLVSDFRSLDIMRKTGYPVVFDATHSVQQPGGLGHASGGNREYVPLLARCAVAAGCDAIFMEVHDNPNKALSDGPNMLFLKDVPALLNQLKKIDAIVKGQQ